MKPGKLAITNAFLLTLALAPKCVPNLKDPTRVFSV
jgi:hypothetical protein